jgi:predicted ATP-grasp superfamily ATP-dependent carboligase
MTRLHSHDTNAPRPLTVLVTDGSYKHTVGIIRALGRAGHTLTTVSDFVLAPGFFSRWTRHYARISSPASDPAAFVADVAKRVQQWQVDLVIPVGYSSVGAISRSPERITSLGARMTVPTVALFDMASDKWRIAEEARRAGIDIPQTELVDSGQAIARFMAGRERAVIKYRHESRKKGVSYITRFSSLDAILKTRPIGSLSDGQSDTIIQEYITGTGTGYMALAVDGHIVREFAHRRRREMPPEGGASTAAVSVHDERVMAAGRRLIEAIKWNGPAMVEFRANERGCYLIEFNPKLWGSLELALAAGADFPGDLCRLAAGEDLTQRSIPDFRNGLRYYWPWRGDLRRLLRRPGDLGAVLGDFLNPRVRSNWWWRDPMPNLIEIGGELLHSLRRHLRTASQT